MNLRKCALCEVQITAANKSREHIVSNAIGGRRKVPNVVCKICNDTTGEEWDSALARQLEFLSLHLHILRERGEIPTGGFRTLGGQKVRVHADGQITFPPQKPEITQHGGQTHIQIHASTKTEAKKALDGLKRRYPKLDVESGMNSINERESYLKEPVIVTCEFGDNSSYRSVVKSALILAVATGIEAQHCQRAVTYLRDPDAQFCFGYYYRRELIVNRPEDCVFHCVAIKGDPQNGRLVGYVELFSIYRFVISLSDSYTGPAVTSSYSVDPTTGEDLELNVDLTFTDEEFQFAVENQDDTAYASQVASFQRVLSIAQHRSFEREQARVLRKAYDSSVKRLALEPGQAMTPAIAEALSREITAAIMPFLTHRFRSHFRCSSEGADC